MGELKPMELKDEGMALFNQGKRDEALATFKLAAEEFKEADDLLGQGEMYNNIGVIHRINRDWSGAEKALGQANELFGELGDSARQAQVLGNMGDLASRKKAYANAERYYSESSSLFASVEEYGMQADVLRALSLMHMRRRKLWEAADTMLQSLNARPKMSIPQRLLYWLLQLATKIMSGGQ